MGAGQNFNPPREEGSGPKFSVTIPLLERCRAADGYRKGLSVVMTWSTSALFGLLFRLLLFEPPLHQAQDDGRETDRFWPIPRRLETLHSLLIARAVISITDYPNGCNGILRIHLEDDPPVAVTNGDLAEPGQVASQRQTSFLAQLFKTDQLGQELHDIAAGHKTVQVGEGVGYQFDANGHLAIELPQLFPCDAEAVQHFVQGESLVGCK